MIFPILNCENVLQVNDKTRIDAKQSFVSAGIEVTSVEIDPDSSGTYYSLDPNSSSQWYLDWLYETSGTKTVKLRITDSNSLQKEIESEVLVLTEAEDALFSNDDQLEKYFNGISQYLPLGKSSFKSVHRESQSIIINKLFKMGVTDEDGKRLPPTAFLEIEEVRQWATYLALEIILQGLSNEPDDKWDHDAGLYAAKASRMMQKTVINLDWNKDGILEDGEGVSFSGIAMRRTW